MPFRRHVVGYDMSKVRSSTADRPLAWTRLDAERTRVQGQLTGLLRSFQEIIDASTDSNADDEHDPEGPTIAFERSQVNALIQQARSHLGEIEAARARLTGGQYGLCEACGQPITAARLDARPVACTCIGCATTTRRVAPDSVPTGDD
jgi:DnaK suppressor protein